MGDLIQHVSLVRHKECARCEVGRRSCLILLLPFVDELRGRVFTCHISVYWPVFCMYLVFLRVGMSATCHVCIYTTICIPIRGIVCCLSPLRFSFYQVNSRPEAKRI